MGPEEEARGRRWARAFAVPLGAEAPLAEPPASRRPPADSEIPTYLYLLRAKNAADRDFAADLDVPALARTAFASPAHFTRAFKQAFGETPHQYLLRRRIERAKDLLRGTDSTVTEVCFRVGFHSLGSFSTAFRNLVGEAPSAYRARWQSESAQVPQCYTLMWTRPRGRAVFEKRDEQRAHTVSDDHDEEVTG